MPTVTMRVVNSGNMMNTAMVANEITIGGIKRESRWKPPETRNRAQPDAGRPRESCNFVALVWGRLALCSGNPRSMPELPIVSEPLPGHPPTRRQPQLRVFQPSPRQLRLDFSGDVDQWSEPLLNAAEMAAASLARADILIDLGDVTALHEITLPTFAQIRRHAADHGRSMRFIQVSDVALRTFDLYRFDY